MNSSSREQTKSALRIIQESALNRNVYLRSKLDTLRAEVDDMALQLRAHGLTIFADRLNEMSAKARPSGR